MTLPEIDTTYLNERAIDHEVIVDAGMICVIVKNYMLPQGFNVMCSDLMLRLSPGYPDVQPDMWWFSPNVQTQTGGVIPQTEVVEIYFGRQWQRWSRHLNPGQWNPGTDSLETFFAIIRSDLNNYAVKAA